MGERPAAPAALTFSRQVNGSGWRVGGAESSSTRRTGLRSAVSNNFLTRQKESATGETRETEGGSLVLWMFSSGAVEDGHELLPNNNPPPTNTDTDTDTEVGHLTILKPISGFNIRLAGKGQTFASPPTPPSASIITRHPLPFVAPPLGLLEPGNSHGWSR